MVIAFDTWILSSRFRYQGYYAYAHRLLREFRKLEFPGGPFVIRPFVNRAVENDANALLAQNCFRPTKSALLRLNRLWRCGGSSIAAFCSRADLLFSPTSYIVPLGLVPAVVTIADAIPARLPAQVFVRGPIMRTFTSLAARLSRKIVTLSECSKRDLVEIYGVPPEKVSVIYCGYNNELYNASPTDDSALDLLLERFGIRRPYLFHHGTIQPRKNLQRLIEAYSRVMERNRNLDLQLVLAGPFGWQHEPIVRAGRALSGRSKVIFSGPLPEEDLALMLKGSLMAAIPSLYEGFCLPMVEAMACGVPTVAARTSCLPEVSGGTLRYFDPLSVEEMADTIEKVVEDGALLKQLADSGIQKVREFTWERCARETLSLLALTFEESAGSNCEQLEAD